MSDSATRILLLEDNPGDARLVREMLNTVEHESFELAAVGRLDETLKLLRR